MKSSHIFSEQEHVSVEADDQRPDYERLPDLRLVAAPIHQVSKRREALHIMIKCCELWQDADSAGFGAVRDKMDQAIMHAHDAFVRLQMDAKGNRKK